MPLVVVETPETSPERGFVFVMSSFMIPKNPKSFLSESDRRRGYEEGTTMLWGSMEEVEEYLDAIREGRDDRPFELRWNYLVVEKVYFGPYSINEVMGWWKATKQENGSVMGYDLEKLEECPLPGVEGCFNFTIGT